MITLECIECDVKIHDEIGPVVTYHILRHLSGNKMPEVSMCGTCWGTRGMSVTYGAKGWLIRDTIKPEKRRITGPRPASLKQRIFVTN